MSHRKTAPFNYLPSLFLKLHINICSKGPSSHFYLTSHPRTDHQSSRSVPCQFTFSKSVMRDCPDPGISITHSSTVNEVTALRLLKSILKKSRFLTLLTSRKDMTIRSDFCVYSFNRILSWNSLWP